MWLLPVDMMRKSFLGAFPLSVVALVAIRADDHHSLLAAVGIEGGYPVHRTMVRLYGHSHGDRQESSAQSYTIDSNLFC